MNTGEIGPKASLLAQTSPGITPQQGISPLPPAESPALPLGLPAYITHTHTQHKLPVGSQTTDRAPVDPARSGRATGMESPPNRDGS